jgi:3-hydroxyisobutyrate dehydrogenase
MGTVIAARLRAAGHKLALYDPALPAGGEGFPSLAAAARRASVVFLCLPDAAAVEASLPGLQEAAPPIVVDLTSSLPATTRRVGAALSHLGVDFIDCPLSGGVAGARAGTLTAMAGGDAAVLDRVRPLLAAFASNVRWAGPLGSGHAVKALNNALSAAALTGSCELLVLGAAGGTEEAAIVAAFNQGSARSQNSEVKLPRDVLPRTYGAGFTCALMVKDLDTALRIATARGVAAPFLNGLLTTWREAMVEMGPDSDFTRIHAVISARSAPPPSGTRRRDPARLSGRADQSRPGGMALPRASLGLLTRALAALNLLAATEVMLVAEAEGLDRERVLAIINKSTGRSEATRTRVAGTVDAAALKAAVASATEAGTSAPLTTLAASLA